eukprot:2624760-Rhodomonas_salina.1
MSSAVARASSRSSAASSSDQSDCSWVDHWWQLGRASQVWHAFPDLQLHRVLLHQGVAELERLHQSQSP